MQKKVIRLYKNYNLDSDVSAFKYGLDICKKLTGWKEYSIAYKPGKADQWMIDQRMQPEQKHL